MTDVGYYSTSNRGNKIMSQHDEVEVVAVPQTSLLRDAIYDVRYRFDDTTLRQVNRLVEVGSEHELLSEVVTARRLVAKCEANVTQGIKTLTDLTTQLERERHVLKAVRCAAIEKVGLQDEQDFSVEPPEVEAERAVKRALAVTGAVK